MKITEILEGKYSGSMAPLTASGKEKSGAVEALERALIKAKKAGTTLDYKNIDAMMQKICKAHNITGQKLHDDFVKANRLIPDNWIKKVDENLANMKNPGMGEYPALTPVMGEEHEAVFRIGGVNKLNPRIEFNRKGTLGRQLVAFKKINGRWVPTHPEAEPYLDLFHHHLKQIGENFADGRHPEDKGDSKRYHVPTKGSVTSLRKYAKGHSGRAAQLAHWMANMKSGHKK
jgi:hypothetical protein